MCAVGCLVGGALSGLCRRLVRGEADRAGVRAGTGLFAVAYAVQGLTAWPAAARPGIRCKLPPDGGAGRRQGRAVWGKTLYNSSSGGVAGAVEEAQSSDRSRRPRRAGPAAPHTTGWSGAHKTRARVRG
jgi:hypothetical protein